MLTILFLYASLGCVADVPYNIWWQRANKHFETKNYDSAAVYYEKLASLQPDNAEVFYNLGNAYYKLNNIGHAILNYERALMINPDYRQAQENLELTQSRIGNRIPQSQDIFFVSWWKTVTKANLSEIWSVTSLILFLLLLLTMLLRRWDKAPGWLQPWSYWLFATLFACTVTLAYFSAHRAEDRDRAVVLETDTPLRDGLKNEKTLVLIPEGTVLSIEHEQAGWANVKLPDGRSGWVRTQALERI